MVHWYLWKQFELPKERIKRVCLLLFARVHLVLKKSFFLFILYQIFRWFSSVSLYALLHCFMACFMNTYLCIKAIIPIE